MKIIFIWLLLTIRLFAQWPGSPGYPGWDQATTPPDTSPPDLFTSVADTFQNVNQVELTFPVSDIDSTDWKDIVLNFDFEQYGVNNPSTMTIPKASVIADSDTVISFQITYNTTPAINATAITDTVDTLNITISVRDSSNNSQSMAVIRTPFYVNVEASRMICDSLYIGYSWTTFLDVWVDSNLTNWSGGTISNSGVPAGAWNKEVACYRKPSRRSGGLDYADGSDYLISEFDAYNVNPLGDSDPFLYPTFLGDSLFSAQRLYVNGTINGKTVVAYPQIIEVIADTVILTQVDSLEFTLAFDGNNINATYLPSDFTDPMGWFGEASFITYSETGFHLGDTSGYIGYVNAFSELLVDSTYSISFSNDTVYAWSKVYSSSGHYSYEYRQTLFRAVDVTPPALTGGSFTAVFDSVYSIDIDTVTTFFTNSTDMSYITIDYRDEDTQSWTTLATVYNDTLSPATYAIPYSFSRDSGFVRISFTDVTANSGVVAIDTFTTTWFDIYTTSDTARKVIDSIKVIRNTSTNALAGSDSIIILSMADADTSSNAADTLLVGIGSPNDGAGAYYATRIEINDVWQSAISNWKWYPAPDSINSYVWSVSATADSDSVRLVASGYDANIDSVVFHKNTGSYSYSNRWFAKTSSVTDTTLLVSEDAGTTLYITAIQYYNGSNSGQDGAEGANKNKVLIPTMAGGGESYAIRWNGDHATDTSYADLRSGAASLDGTVSGTVEISPTYGQVGNGLRITNNNEYVLWALSGADTINRDSATVWFSIKTDASEDFIADATFWESYIASTDYLRVLIRTSDEKISLTTKGNNVTETFASSGAVNTGNWIRCAISWNIATAKVSLYDSVSDSWNESSSSTYTKSVDVFNEFIFGEHNAGGAFNHNVLIDNGYLVNGDYQSDDPYSP